jgi:prepilin-type N-terminal cleavage/methylation domain-containing protein
VFKLHHELQERRKAGESSESGFTLIELLIVIVVLGILAAIVIFSLTGVTQNSQVAACNTDAKSVETAVAAYQANPPSGVTPGSNPATSFVSGTVDGLVPNYLHSGPTATVANNGYAVSLTSGGVVNVTIGTTTTAYDSSNSCAGA